MTQTDRVLAALYVNPDRGITQVDFLLPNVIDGGSPITRVAARIRELRLNGHEVISDGERDSCAVYKLEQRPAETRRPSPPPTLGVDAFSHKPRNAIFDDDWEAA